LASCVDLIRRVKDPGRDEISMTFRRLMDVRGQRTSRADVRIAGPGQCGRQDGRVSILDDWVAEATAALGVDASELDVADVLDLARDVAHGIARPAAPVTAFLVGLAAGRAGGDVPSAVRAATATVSSLLRERGDTPGPPPSR
jgi:hypothetical protein